MFNVAYTIHSFVPYFCLQTINIETKKLTTITKHLTTIEKVSIYLILHMFYVYVLSIVVCSYVLFLLVIVLSVLLRYMVSGCPFGIFKLFLTCIMFSC